MVLLGLATRHCSPTLFSAPQRVKKPNDKVLELRPVITLVQVLGKHMIIRYFDAESSIPLDSHVAVPYCVTLELMLSKV